MNYLEGGKLKQNLEENSRKSESERDRKRLLRFETMVWFGWILEREEYFAAAEEEWRESVAKRENHIVSINHHIPNSKYTYLKNEIFLIFFLFFFISFYFFAFPIVFLFVFREHICIQLTFENEFTFSIHLKHFFLFSFSYSYSYSSHSILFHQFKNKNENRINYLCVLRHFFRVWSLVVGETSHSAKHLLLELMVLVLFGWLNWY